MKGMVIWGYAQNPKPPLSGSVGTTAQLTQLGKTSGASNGGYRIGMGGLRELYRMDTL